MRLLCIDPGSQRSGWVIFDTDTEAVIDAGKDENLTVLEIVRVEGSYLLTVPTPVIIETMTGRAGQPFGPEVIDTLIWVGRYFEAARTARLMSRTEVKRVLLGRVNQPGADAHIRQAIIDRYGGSGGRSAAVGRKASPGPLYGVKADAWAALALALAWTDRQREDAA